MLMTDQILKKFEKFTYIDKRLSQFSIIHNEHVEDVLILLTFLFPNLCQNNQGDYYIEPEGIDSDDFLVLWSVSTPSPLYILDIRIIKNRGRVFDNDL